MSDERMDVGVEAARTTRMTTNRGKIEIVEEAVAEAIEEAVAE